MFKKLVCLACSRSVTNFKSGSHIVPKWALVLTKRNGRNLKFTKNVFSVNMPDKKTNSWCADCEKKFHALDTLGAAFFRDRLDFEKQIDIQNDEVSGSVEVRLKNNYKEISRFVASIFVREYLHRKEGNLSDADEFRELFDLYVKNNVFDFVCIYFQKLKYSVQEPVFTDAYQLMLNGYLIKLFASTQEIPLEARHYVGLEKMFIPIHTDVNDPYTQMILSHSRKK